MLIDTELQALDNQDAAARLGLPQTGAPPVDRSVPPPAAPPVPTPVAPPAPPVAPPVAAARVAAPVPPAPAPSAPSAAAPSAAAPKAAPAGWRRRWGLTGFQCHQEELKRFVGGFFAWNGFRFQFSWVFEWCFSLISTSDRGPHLGGFNAGALDHSWVHPARTKSPPAVRKQKTVALLNGCETLDETWGGWSKRLRSQ